MFSAMIGLLFCFLVCAAIPKIKESHKSRILRTGLTLYEPQFVNILTPPIFVTSKFYILVVMMIDELRMYPCDKQYCTSSENVLMNRLLRMS